MLEQLGQQLSKAFLAVVVVVLSLAFIISSPFGNQDGCRPAGVTYAAKVYGETITPGDFEAALALASYAMSGGRSTQLPREMAERYEIRRHVLNGLVERTLLARRARELGFDVSQDEIWRYLADDGSAMLSMGIDAPPQMASTELRLSLRDEDGAFDREGHRESDSVRSASKPRGVRRKSDRRATGRPDARGRHRHGASQPRRGLGRLRAGKGTGGHLVRPILSRVISRSASRSTMRQCRRGSQRTKRSSDRSTSRDSVNTRISRNRCARATS